MTTPDLCCHGDCNQGRECPLRAVEHHDVQPVDSVSTFLLGLACGLALAGMLAASWGWLP